MVRHSTWVAAVAADIGVVRILVAVDTAAARTPAAMVDTAVVTATAVDTAAAMVGIGVVRTLAGMMDTGVGQAASDTAAGWDPDTTCVRTSS